MINLSNRGFPMLERFLAAGNGSYMSIREAQKFDQRPFRSMLKRGYIAYHPGHGFSVTRKGRDAWREFHETSIERKNPFGRLTAFFDPMFYGLTESIFERAKVRIIGKGKAA